MPPGELIRRARSPGKPVPVCGPRVRTSPYARRTAVPAVTARQAVEGAVTGVLAAEVEHRSAPRALEEHLGRQRLEDRSVVPDGVHGSAGRRAR